jgi:hypothetical protein
MSIKDLDDAKKAFTNTYSAKELFDLVFTDYKNAPSELVKIPNLNDYAKARVSQIVNATGTPAKAVQDFFTIVQEVITLVDIQAEAAIAAAVAAEEAATAVAVATDFGGDAGSGGGGGG